MTPKHLKNEKGMTLIEIMIVLVIIAGLSGFLINNVMNSMRRAEMREAKILISEVGKALDEYYMSCSTYPSTDQGLEALIEAPPEGCDDWGPDAYIKKIPKDPWGKPLIYELEDDGYFVGSLGGDKREGGSGYAKDISNKESTSDK